MWQKAIVCTSRARLQIKMLKYFKLQIYGAEWSPRFFCGDAVWAEFLSFSYKRLIKFANFVSHRKDDKVLKMETKLG